MKQGTANLAEDYCFIHKALRPVSKARRKIAAVPPSNSRPVIACGRSCVVGRAWSCAVGRSRSWSCVVVRGRTWSFVAVRGRALSFAVERPLVSC